MIKLFSFIMLLLSVVPTTIEQEKFITTVNDCYEEYIYAVNEEIEFGQVTICFGTYKNKYYVSAFILSESSLSPNIYIYVNNKLTTCVAEGTVANAYGIKVDSNDTLKIIMGKDPQTKTYELSLDELISNLQQTAIKGNSQGNFPSNKRESYVLSLLKLLLIGFGIFAVVLIIILFIIIKKGKSIFAKKVYYNDEYEDYYNYKKEDEDVIEATYEDNNEVDRQVLMDKYFEEYRSGDITEDELNEKLKKLWWKNDQN